MSLIALIRTVANVLLVALVTLTFCFRAYWSRLFDPTGDAVIELARGWGRWTTRLAGLRVVTRTLVAIDPARPYVFMANHTSAADIWALYAALPVRVRMIAKKQLAAIPFLGWAMTAGRFIFIDRGNPQAARRSIDEAARRISGGDSVLLFPEGTRSRDGKLSDFKKGGFHLAVTSGVEIVPVAVRGAFELLPPDSFFPRPGLIEVIIGEPIATAGLSELDRGQLRARVHDAITRLLQTAPHDQ